MNLPRLYGVKEFAAALAKAFPEKNWSSRMLSSYMSRGYAGLPEPVQVLAATPVWTEEQVEEYVERRRGDEHRKP